MRQQSSVNLKRDIPAVFLAMKNKDTPIIAKAFALIAVIYALSPIDLIPDFIPALGYLDDMVLLPVMISLTIKFIPSTIFEKCQQEAEGMWEHGKPKEWYYAIPVVLVWIGLGWVIVKAVFL